MEEPLIALLNEALTEAQERRSGSVKPDESRALSIVITKLQEAKAFALVASDRLTL